MGKKNDQLLVIGETNDQKHFIDGKKNDQLLVIGETNDQKHFIDGEKKRSVTCYR